MTVEQHEQGFAKISELKGADYNPRVMPDAEMRNLMQSLREFGFVQPVAARKEDGLILGGHQRVEAMKRIAAEMGGTADITIPVVWISGLSDEKAKLLNVALNRIHGEWDFEKLGELFTSLAPELPAVELTGSGFSGKEIDDIIKLTAVDAAPTFNNDDAPEPVAPPSATVKFSFVVAKAEAAVVAEALAALGKDKNAALVKMARASLAHAICEKELCE